MDTGLPHMKFCKGCAVLWLFEEMSAFCSSTLPSGCQRLVGQQCSMLLYLCCKKDQDAGMLAVLSKRSFVEVANADQGPAG